MMRPFPFAVALATCAFSAAVSAQPAPQAPSEPADSATAPPEESETPRVPRTIVTEKRERGQFTGATVTQGNNTYHLKPNTQIGSAQPGDAQSSGNRAAQWQVLQFDWQRQSEAPRPPAPPASAPPSASQN